MSESWAPCYGHLRRLDAEMGWFPHNFRTNPANSITTQRLGAYIVTGGPFVPCEEWSFASDPAREREIPFPVLTHKDREDCSWSSWWAVNNYRPFRRCLSFSFIVFQLQLLANSVAEPTNQSGNRRVKNDQHISIKKFCQIHLSIDMFPLTLSFGCKFPIGLIHIRILHVDTGRRS